MGGRQGDRDKARLQPPKYFLLILYTLLQQYGITQVETRWFLILFSSFVIRIFVNTRWICLRRAYYVPAYVHVCGYLPVCLPTWFTDSRRYSRRKCVSTSRTRLWGRHGSTRPDCAVQVYSAVSTSGRGKGVPRRSYTHATRRRRSMTEKKKTYGKYGATMPKLHSRDRSVLLSNRLRVFAMTLNIKRTHMRPNVVSRYYYRHEVGRKLRQADPQYFDFDHISLRS